MVGSAAGGEGPAAAGVGEARGVAAGAVGVVAPEGGLSPLFSLLAVTHVNWIRGPGVNCSHWQSICQ